MTTPHETPDPFLAKPSEGTPEQPFSQPPAPMAPPGYAPAQPGYPPMAPMGYTPITVPPRVPSTVATWATVLTGLYVAVGIASAALAPGTVDNLKKVLADPENAKPFATTSPIDMLAFPIEVASFVLLALWMSKIRAARKARGEVVGGPPAVEWWGWFVPLANIALPFLGMRAITKGRANIGLLAGWWLPYCVAIGTSAVASTLTFRAIDFSTGKLTHPDAFDSMVPLMWVSAIALAVSWVFLVMIIRVTTRKEAAA